MRNIIVIDLNEAPIQVDIDSFYKQMSISKERFFQIRDDDGSTHRKVFTKSAIQKNKQKPSFSVAFAESIAPIFTRETGLQLTYSYTHGNFWTFISREDIGRIERWEKDQGTRVFLRDTLFSSIALNEREKNDKETRHGEAFRILKYKEEPNRYERAFNWAVDNFCDAINNLPYYNTCRFICAVPPRPEKEDDLPTDLVKAISQRLNLIDITGCFEYTHKKPEAKNSARNLKWKAWEEAGLLFNSYLLGVNFKGYDVILLDDLYQSGISVNYVGMKLQQAGFNRICGLYLVKSKCDTDNVSFRTGI